MHSEEVRALFEQVRPVLWANVGVACIVCATLYGHVPQERLLAWLVAILFLTTLRVLFHASYSREKPKADEIESWGRRFVLGSTASGMLWGAAGLLFFRSDSLLSQGLLTFALAGMTAAAAGTLASHLPAFFGYALPALAPLAVRALWEGDPIHYGMAAMVVAFAIGMQRVARNNHRVLVRAFSLAHENQRLLNQLSLSQVELQETNRTLEHRVLERTQALEQQAEALRQAQRLELAGRLAGGLAHDFNSLLTVVINNSVALKEQQPLDEQGAQATDEMLQAGQRGVALIRQLLAFSRRKRAEPRAFSLNQLVREWSLLFQHILGHEVTIDVRLEARDFDARADPAQVEQVLVNLVASARSRLRGDGKLLLSTRMLNLTADAQLAPADYAELSIEFSGRQPSDDEPEQPLDPLMSFNVDSRQRGVGLASVWATAQEWGGRISVDTENTDHVRYSVLMPAAVSSRRGAKLTPTPSSKKRRSATVLVVDDEPTLRAVVRRALLREGYSVLTAEDGQRALALAAGHSGPIDLLLTDVVMPGLSGLEVARQLRTERPLLPVLYISGFTFEEEVPKNDLTQLLGYLPKPFDTRQLVNKVAELLVARSVAESEARDVRPESR